MSELEFTDITVKYDTVPVLRDISFEIPENSIVALVGRNGVGKTTLMKTVIGLLSPSSGSIHYRGNDITRDSADTRAKLGMGYVPQGRDVFPRMTVEENLKMGETVNESRDRLDYEEIYSLFPRLESRREQRAGTMSGGEQQMLAIARALIGNPYLLLLDEPSEGVQPNIVTQIGETLEDITSRFDVTILFSEQNVEFTTSVAETALIMENGSIVERLATAELRNSEVAKEYIGI